MEMFDVAFVNIRTNKATGEVKGHEEIEKILGEGYEPFAVTTHVEAEAPSGVATLSARGQPVPIMVEKMWFKKRTIVPVTPSSDNPSVQA